MKNLSREREKVEKEDGMEESNREEEYDQQQGEKLQEEEDR